MHWYVKYNLWTQIIWYFSKSIYNIKNVFNPSITSCEAESNFSKLSYIKNKHRTTILDKRLNYLLMLSSEHDITKSTSYDAAIYEFAHNKIRRKKII